MFSLAVAIIGLARTILNYLASQNSADAVRARIVLKSMEAFDAKIQAAVAARDDALAQLDASGVSDDTHFRD